MKRADRQLWLLVGGNGAGKSTFYELLLEPRGVPYVNADRIARIIAPDAPESVGYDAARIAGRIRQQLLDHGASFCFETVFSHISKVDFVAEAKALGYEIILVLVHLDQPQLNLARVAQRVAAGGHAVPEDKVRSRLPRTLENVRRALPIADQVHLLDNSRCDDPFRRIASLVDGELTMHTSPLPGWARDVLGDYLEER
jgi:predicted ABC-type ATPase